MMPVEKWEALLMVLLVLVMMGALAIHAAKETEVVVLEGRPQRTPAEEEAWFEYWRSGGD